MCRLSGLQTDQTESTKNTRLLTHFRTGHKHNAVTQFEGSTSWVFVRRRRQVLTLACILWCTLRYFRLTKQGALAFNVSALAYVA